MKKPNKEQIVASAWRDAPNEGVLYVSDSGTVLTQEVYNKRADKSGCDKFVNPAYAEAEVEEVKKPAPAKKKKEDDTKK